MSEVRNIGDARARKATRDSAKRIAEARNRRRATLTLGVDPTTGRVRIRASGRDQTRVYDDIINSWVLSNGGEPFLFLHGGKLATVSPAPSGSRALKALSTAAAVVDIAAHCADFVGKKQNSVRPDQQNVTAARARAERTGALPELIDIVRFPIITPGGRLLNEPGYDADTRLYYSPSSPIVLPAVSASKRAVRQAVRRLQEITQDFPLEDGASRANLFAFLYTVLCRELISGVTPIFLIDATAPGSGKTLLLQIASVLTTGEEFQIGVLPETEEERRKNITATLRAGGVRIIGFDNVVGKVDSGVLAAYATAPRWTDRLLGGNERVEYDIRAILALTGNNVRVVGDLLRRVVWIRLVPDGPHPESRDPESFRHPQLLPWIKEKRDELLAALYSIPMLWLKNGRPAPAAAVPPLGSFEQWRHVIGGMLELAGVEGFLGNAGRVYAEIDNAADDWAIFLLAVGAKAKRLDLGALSCATLAGWTEYDDEIRAVLPTSVNLRASNLATQLGAQFRSKRERWFELPGGAKVRVQKAGENRAGSGQWQVVVEPKSAIDQYLEENPELGEREVAMAAVFGEAGVARLPNDSGGA